MKSDRKFLKPKKGMAYNTGKVHNQQNNENKIAVTHIDRIQDSVHYTHCRAPKDKATGYYLIEVNLFYILVYMSIKSMIIIQFQTILVWKI